MISPRGKEGFSSCSACPCHRAGASTPPKRWSRIDQISAPPCCLRPTVGGSAFGATHFRGHFCIYCRYGPVTRRLPKEDVVDRLQSFGFPPPCYPNYEASVLAPAGLSPAEHASLRWTHNRTCGFPAYGFPTDFMAKLSALGWDGVSRATRPPVRRRSPNERSFARPGFASCSFARGKRARDRRRSDRRPDTPWRDCRSRNRPTSRAEACSAFGGLSAMGPCSRASAFRRSWP